MEIGNEKPKQINFKMNSLYTKIYLFLLILSLNNLFAEYYFYHNYNYGSEYQFNPISVIINNGYDISQFTDKSREITNFPYKYAINNVFNSLVHPIKTIDNYGLKRFINNEIFPLSNDFSFNGEQWYPNYTIHLIGNGMTSRKLKEWFMFHNYKHPDFYSISTSIFFHIFNEVMENGNYIGYNADSVADIYIFDILGIILFRSDKVCNFFNKKLNLADWSLQPSIRINNAEIHNQGQYYSMKLKLPKKDKIYLFGSFGLDGLIGLSYKLKDNKFLSLGYGYIGRENIIIDEDKNIQGVLLEKSFGLFYDKNNSLLGSVRYSEKFYYKWLINLYPGIYKKNKWGCFFGINHKNRYIFGINYIIPLGVVIN